MYAKIFASILDSTLADNWKARIVFQDLLVVSDKDGYIDATPQAISRRTGVPLEIVQEGLRVLAQPDPASRSQAYEGRRIIPLCFDDGTPRPWGWQVVNKAYYASLKDADEVREAARVRQKRHYDKVRSASQSQTLTHPHASSRNLTQPNATSRHIDVDVDVEPERVCAEPGEPDSPPGEEDASWDEGHPLEGEEPSTTPAVSPETPLPAPIAPPPAPAAPKPAPRPLAARPVEIRLEGLSPAEQEEDVVFGEFPCVGPVQKTVPVYFSFFRPLRALYPGIDVYREAEKARQWLLANPTRRKTPGGMRRFILSWLGRAQDRARA